MDASSEPGGATPLYPLGLRLAGRPVVVVGAGTVALRRASALLAAGAVVHVVAPTATPALADLADTGRLTWSQRPYADADLEGAWLVLACTDDPAVNAAVAAEAERRRVFCSRADEALGGSAWVPAVGRAGSATVAVHADRDPRRAVELRDRLVEAALSAGLAPDRARSGRGGRVVLVGGGPG